MGKGWLGSILRVPWVDLAKDRATRLLSRRITCGVVAAVVMVAQKSKSIWRVMMISKSEKVGTNDDSGNNNNRSTVIIQSSTGLNTFAPVIPNKRAQAHPGYHESNKLE